LPGGRRVLRAGDRQAGSELLRGLAGALGLARTDRHPVPGHREPPRETLALVPGTAEDADRQSAHVREVVRRLLLLSHAAESARRAAGGGEPGRHLAEPPCPDRPLRPPGPVGAEQIIMLREVLSATGWLERAKEFVRALLVATKTPGSLLLVGTPGHRPWHLAPP